MEQILSASKGSSEKKMQESMTYEQIKQKYLESSYRILDSTHGKSSDELRQKLDDLKG